MYKFGFILIMACLSTSVFSQERLEMAVAKYKNGVFYVGEKVAEKGDTILLKLNTQDIVTIDRSQLSKYYDSKSALIFSNGKYFETQDGFWNLSFGFNPIGGFDSLDQRVSTHIEFFYGRRINKDLNFGAGISFEFNEAKVAGFQFDTQFTSLFAYGRYYLNKSSKRLFVFSRIGIGFPGDENQEDITGEYNGGLNTLNGLGLHWASRRNSRFQISLGYYTQKTNGREFFLDPIGNEIEANYDILIKRLIFKFGWEFG